MSLTAVIITSFVQVFFVFALYIGAIMMMAGADAEGRLSSVTEVVLAVLAHAVPLSGLVAIGMVVYQYNVYGAASYWWHCLPLPFFVAFMVQFTLLKA